MGRQREEDFSSKILLWGEMEAVLAVEERLSPKELRVMEGVSCLCPAAPSLPHQRWECSQAPFWPLQTGVGKAFFPEPQTAQS